MRSIPQSIQDKINKQNQTIFDNADPKMSVVIARARSSIMDSTYFTIEKIRQKAGITDIAVAARRLNNYGPPDRLYNIWLDNGLVRTGHREYPDKLKAGWQNDFDIESGKAVSIVFDGRWELNYKKTWGKRTEELPWVFWVTTTGVLKAKIWDTGTTYELSTGVVMIDSIRGWVPAQAGHTDDQGVIVAYTKADGKVYCRNYCIQETEGLTIWEPEQEVTELGAGNQGIRLFRTNDFRVGIIGEKPLGNTMIVTNRNWAGMSIEPESLIARPTMEVDFIPLEYIDSPLMNERLNATATIRELALCDSTVPEPIPTKATRVGGKIIILEFNQKLINYSDLQSQFILTATGIIPPIASIELGDTDQKLKITTRNEVDITLDITIQFESILSNFRTEVTQTCRRFLQDFTIIASGKPMDGYANESIKVNPTMMVELKPIIKSNSYLNESIIANPTMNVNLYKVEDAPV